MKKNIRYIFVPALVLLTAGVAGPEAGDGALLTHRMMLLAIQLGLLILAARSCNQLFERFHLPGVLGELIAGMIIGPFCLGGLPLIGFPHGLFPLGQAGFPLSHELYGVCCIAAIVLLFNAGLETDLDLFLRFSMAGGAIGIGGVAASFVIGDLTTMLFSKWLFGEWAGFFDMRCIFLGLLSTPTSVGITARVLSDKRKMDSPEAVTILSGAVIDDVLGIILLAIVLGVNSAGDHNQQVDWGHIGIIAAKALGIWLAATALGLYMARRISRLLKKIYDRTYIAISSLALAMILGGLFEEAGLAMIIGAYVMGLTLSRTDISRVVQEHMEPLYKFFVPVFFCAMGMMVNLSTLGSSAVLVFALVYALTAIVSKLIGCSLPALLFNFNKLGAMRIGIGMAPRGEVASTIAGIGLACGILAPELFSVAIVMSVITILVVPALLGALFQQPAAGTRTPLTTTEKTTLTFDLPSPQIVNLLLDKLMEAFDQEGFFVHTLKRGQVRVYQFLKDDMTIMVRSLENAIVFDSAATDRSFIATAVYEQIHELEKMIKGLNKPIDSREIACRMQARDEAATARKLKLVHILKPEWIVPELRAETKEDAIDELLALFVRDGVVNDEEKVRHGLLERERVISTGMQHGLALPHVKTDAVDRLVCAVGIKRDGIDFDSLDGELTRIVVLELAPEQATSPHLQFMATISQVLQQEVCNLLLAAKNQKTIYQILTGQPLV